MAWPVEIKISELRTIVNRILDHIEDDLHIVSVTLDQDDYWDVLDDERYDFSKTPSDYGCGKLSDDWEFLRSAKVQNEAVALLLIHAAPLLRWLGEEVGQ